MRNHHPCSGCGLWHCDGQCFLECEADYPEDEPTTSTLTIADLLAKYGSQLTEVRGDPFLKSRAA
jgi:hypothetical protein